MVGRGHRCTRPLEGTSNDFTWRDPVAAKIVSYKIGAGNHIVTLHEREDEMKIRALRFKNGGMDCYFHYAGICVRPVQYLNEFACENKGKWTEAFCTGSEYNEKVACETPGTWNEGMCSAPSSTTETGTTAANIFVTFT